MLTTVGVAWHLLAFRPPPATILHFRQSFTFLATDNSVNNSRRTTDTIFRKLSSSASNNGSSSESRGNSLNNLRRATNTINTTLSGSTSSNSSSSNTMAGKQEVLSSLTASKPNKALVSPGKCQLTDDPKPIKLMKRVTVSDTTSLLRFLLPDQSEPLKLSTCACVLAKAKISNDKGEMEDVIRPYTPISTNKQVGTFDLLIKVR